MNTQSTPVHIRLWHKEFWLLVVANLLLSMSVTLLIPTFPQWSLYTTGLSVEETGWVMGIFAAGLFLMGPFCSKLVQKYRRNQVCIWAIFGLALTILLPVYVKHIDFWQLLLIRLLQGTAFGLAQMVLASTLVIDTCESFQRTEANHSATWFGRFALSLGPMAGLLLYRQLGMEYVFYTAAGCSLAAALLILFVHFPFRVPSEDVQSISLDRFFLGSGWPLFLNLFVVSLSIGLVFSLRFEPVDFALMMIGFLLALLAQRFVFADAELKSEAVTGLLLMIAAILILIYVPSSSLHFSLLGLGLGILGARFLLLFIKLSRHCQRGTAQSTFILGWESGMALGIGLGIGLFDGNRDGLLFTALFLVTLGMMAYVLFIHQWFIQHKNR